MDLHKPCTTENVLSINTCWTVSIHVTFLNKDNSRVSVKQRLLCPEQSPMEKHLLHLDVLCVKKAAKTSDKLLLLDGHVMQVWVSSRYNKPFPQP